MINLKHPLLFFLQAPGPLAEIVHWQERASVLTALRDQLKQPVVKKILEVISKTNGGIVHTHKETVAELTKYHLEAEDNLCFLKTLERHFMVNFVLLNA